MKSRLGVKHVMNSSRLIEVIPAILGVWGMVGSIDAAQTVLTPQTRVSYSDAYGKTAPQPELASREMPRFPSVEPAKASGTFQIKPGFRLELAASEPLITSPVTVCFDELGRLFVAEMIDYSERREETPHAGRIRLLEDVDGDGVFDKSTVYADNLPWPTALICSRGGVYVGATPDIIWLKDTNGDDKADERRVVFTGFGSGASRLNVQALINSFNWGLDNRIHGATGPIGGNRVQPVPPLEGPVLDLRGLDFSFDPLTHRIRPESGGGQYGLSFDSAGRKFVCSNSDHLQLILMDHRYMARKSDIAMPSSRVSIAADGPAAEVFRISPDEPWRIVRTRWRISGVVPGGVEGGGRVSGYFTGATGATIYRGDAYGPDFVDNAFIGDAGGNLVHRKLLSPDGMSLVARRPDDEKEVEFLASRDTWFRPVHFQNGPDGCLYVVDMYREVIEHPWSIPEAIKKHVDLNSGNDRGRLWRIVPERFQRPKRLVLGTASSLELVRALESANGWTRETASRLIYEQQDKMAIPALESLVSNSTTALGRMHGLYALAGLGALDVSRHLLGRLADPDSRVRQHAIRLSELFLINSNGSPALVERLLSMTADESLQVRYQLALSLGEVRHPGRTTALVALARRDAGDPWMTVAILNSLSDGAWAMFTALVSDRTLLEAKGGADFTAKLVQLIGARHHETEVEGVLEFALQAQNARWMASLARALLAGSSRAGVSPSTLDRGGRLKSLFDRARLRAVDGRLEDRERLEAIQLLALTTFEESGKILATLVTGGEVGDPIRAAAISSLAQYPNPEVATILLQSWREYSGRLRAEALAALTTRTDRVRVLLAALESKTVNASEIPLATVASLRGHKDTSIARLANQVFPPESSSADVLKSFQGSLPLAGDAERGKPIYLERCASCHRVGKDGSALGPDFVTVKSGGKEKLLTSILHPNAEVAPQYIAFQVETRDDDSYLTIIANETTSHVTLRMANQQELTLPRTKIKGMKSSGQSLMPDGLGAGLTWQQMADLLEFVSKAEPPK